MIKYRNKKVISVGDFDNLVIETYGKPYSFQQQDGCKERGSFDFSIPDKWGFKDFENTEIPFVVNGDEMGVSFETWLNTTEEDINKHFNPNHRWKADLFWSRNFYPSVNMIIEDLHKKGLIEEGDYTIDIDW
jgi:hypothetical protein